MHQLDQAERMEMTAVAVYCGSRTGARAAWCEAARALGRVLAEENIRVVYGGLASGLMGALASGVTECGGHLTGIVPRALAEQATVHPGLSEKQVVESLYERKSAMLELADAAIVLPGGVGTQDEFWDVLVSAQLGLHSKPCGILNVDGYYDSLLQFLALAHHEGFLGDTDNDNIVVDGNAGALIKALS